MNTKQIIILFFLLLGTTPFYAQSNIGFSIATSKNDKHLETLWYQQQLSERFSIGLQLRSSSVRYRFINAQAIEKGNTAFTGLVLGFKLKETEKYRLDFNLTTSYRRLKNKETIELPTSSNGLEIDPNFIFGMRLNNTIYFHTGAMLRVARQFSPETIGDEQLPSAIVLTGFSFKKKEHTISLKTYAGPMNGATGDTEKFFWQVALGYQYNFQPNTVSTIPFFNF